MEKIDNALVTPTSGKIENIEEEYVRIGTTLFRIINQPMMNGSFRKMRVEWKMSVFRLDLLSSTGSILQSPSISKSHPLKVSCR